MDALPIEIIREILEAAIDEGRTTPGQLRLDYASLSKYREQQALIRKLGSVCHRWRSISLEFLFEHVWIAPPLEPNILAFRQIFDTDTLCRHSRNSPGWWTRQLYLDMLFLEPSERKALINHFQVNNPFPNVNHLFIFNCRRNGDEENGKLILDVYAKHLTSLVLNGSKNTFRDMISCAPGALSQLRELALEFSWFSDESGSGQDKRGDPVLPSVHTLHLRKPKSNEYSALLDWGFPSLQTLGISTTHSYPNIFGVFVYRHGSNLTSLSIPYWPSRASIHNELFEGCPALERLEILGARWEEEDGVRRPIPVTITYSPFMEEHGLQEWIFRPFWVDCDFDSTFEDCIADPELFPELQKIRLLSPGMDKIFSVPLRRVQSLKEWSRELSMRGVSLVDEEDVPYFKEPLPPPLDSEGDSLYDLYSE